MNENIMFICLPPNSTHLCQPLDVALFAPMKRKWREILHSYKTKNPNISAVQKPKFPALMKRLLSLMSDTIHTNMISGFRATGIYPINREVVKLKLQFNQVTETPNNTDVISFLREQRGVTQPTQESSGPSTSVEQGVQPSSFTSGTASSSVATPAVPKKRPRKSKDITPGRAVQPMDLSSAGPTTKKVRATSVVQKKKDSNTVAVSVDKTPPPRMSEDVEAIIEAASVPFVGECVVIKYVLKNKTKNFAAIITNIDGQEVNVKFLKNVNEIKSIFTLNEKDTSWENVGAIVKYNIPYTINNRDQYVFENSLNVD